MSIPEPHRAIVVSVQVGKPQQLAELGQQSWTSGIIKGPVNGPVWLGKLNLDGDGQADLVHHGGADKPVCAYSADHYSYWRQNLQRDDLRFGAFGENLTINGLNEGDVCIGDIWNIGNASLQVSQPRQPCWKLARRWHIKDLTHQIQQNGRTGWYFRVLREGFIETGTEIKLVERLHAEWTVAEANRIMHHDKTNRERTSQLAELQSLSLSWRITLRNRADKNFLSNETKRLEGEV